LYRISALANPESGHFPEIRPSPAPAKFLAGFGDTSAAAVSHAVQLITDKTDAAVLSSSVFAILISVIRTKEGKIHCHTTHFAKSWQTVTQQRNH